MKIYTRKGDGGQTGIWGGRRLDKDHARMEAIGAVDECNAAVGVAAAADLPGNVAAVLAEVQDCLFVVGCELMAPDRTGAGGSVPRLTGDEVARLESLIDELEAELPELTSFIHPTGSPEAANLHLARAVCRRAERRVTTVRRTEPVSDHVAAYLNRLADLLFVLARYANFTAGVADRKWSPAQ
ncbi:cob(I)yrinic acid a,c-diamide adenosyltransferase [Actinomadura sp. KC216]|uniref:cob(I)yrinic acid a,c-diamide adenosyltransferase n=1 Tax=Actinomadura sp. KC216 TaxID=2530370 RepID=UPI00104F1A3F|nr:cob(I)yrinic acid a,c-diamide adenosyltransferase [Actinomadura sp. KC216]TDB78681.1 cob(I)yrinic acid a,c-diamide adenosyltransferase [Actinomadura sp. KC216]